MAKASKESIANAAHRAAFASEGAPSKGQSVALERHRRDCCAAGLILAFGLVPIVDILKNGAPENYMQVNIGLGGALIVVLADLAWTIFKQARVEASCARLMGVPLEEFRKTKSSNAAEVERMIEAYNLSKQQRSELAAEIPPALSSGAARRRRAL